MKKVVLLLLLCMCRISVHAQLDAVSIGDIIDIHGVKAIVFQVDENDNHGKAMTINCLRGVKNMWCNDNTLADAMPTIASENDGYSNTMTVIEYARSENALAKFPVYEWCSKLGDGWYILSLKELESFVNFWLGNEQEIDWDDAIEEEYEVDDSKPFYKQINMKMLDAGGTPFLNGVFTSTVDSDGKVYVFMFNQKKNSWSFRKHPKEKLSKYYVGRAFYRF